jgi:hypothetical protein
MIFPLPAPSLVRVIDGQRREFALADAGTEAGAPAEGAHRAR